jgi:hypothetical protein
MGKRKLIKTFFIVVVAIIFSYLVKPLQVNAGPFKTSDGGVWDFRVHAKIHKISKGFALSIYVKNDSTSKLYKCGGCYCATANVDWEIWHPDAGMLKSGSYMFPDICNGTEAHTNVGVFSKKNYGVLEVRTNVTTPNHGHSFHKRSQTYRW